MASQTWTANDPVSNRWAAAFAMGNGFFAFEGDQWLGYRGLYPEAIPFPKVVQASRKLLGRTETITRLDTPQFAAQSVTLSSGRLYILFVGATEYGGRIVDTYALADGSYVESFLLPRAVGSISIAGGTVYAIYNAPSPGLVAWRSDQISFP